MNQGAFLMKGLDSDRAEFSLTALAYQGLPLWNGVVNFDDRCRASRLPMNKAKLIDGYSVRLTCTALFLNAGYPPPL
jgi:hypothetical protein